MRLQQKIVQTIMTKNSNVNENIKKAMLQQLMLIFASIKTMEIAEAVDDDGQKSTATSTATLTATKNIAVPSNETGKDVLVRLYHEQREQVLLFGVTTDEIMIEALAVMKRICANTTIKNVPQNLPLHNPFTTTEFSKALSSWQNDMPSCAGYLVGRDMYISRQLFFLPSKNSKAGFGVLPSFFGTKKSIKWKTCRIVCEQKKLCIFDGKNTDEDILSGTTPPMFLIEMHRKLVLTPLKVYTNKYGEEKFSLSIVETDVRRKTLKTDTDLELIRLGFMYPEQYRFFHTLLAITMDSFHR